jgi:heme-degrading monooxygenase HmoA
MFANMAFATPLPGKEQEMIEVMQNFGKTLQGSPGLLRVHVMQEKDGNTLLGISMWENEEAFAQAMARANATPSGGSKSEAIRQSPPIVRKFIEV